MHTVPLNPPWLPRPVGQADISDEDARRELLALKRRRPVKKPATTMRAGCEARAASHGAGEAPG